MSLIGYYQVNLTHKKFEVFKVYHLVPAINFLG